jgi:tripartite-type tricarboxylate transporter receptor subunit TctC
VPFPAGAGPDHVARMLGQHLQEAFGQTVLIENRAGALGSIGAVEVSHSAPDGYTLLMGTNTTQAGNVAMMKDLPYDPIKDFSQICIGQLQSRGGLTVIAASYRGVPQAVTDVMAGAISLTFADLSLAIPQIKGGTLRGIGVSSPQRNELAPDLPALAEAMPGFEATIWYGLLAPAKTPDTIVNKLYAESEKFLSLPATREKLASVGVVVATMPPKEFGSFIASEIVRWTADAKAAGIEPQ